MSKREEMVPRYKSRSSLYYWEGQENEGFRVHNFKPLFYYIIEQEAITHGIKISRRVEPIFITRQENVILLKAKPTIAKGVLMVVRVKYNEPRVNHQDGNIVNGVPRIGGEEFIV
jgi:hypothetical protein